MLKIHRTSTEGNILGEDLTGVDSCHKDVKQYTEEMRRLCEIHVGVGISANQVGIRENFFYVPKGVLKSKKGKLPPHTCVNPTWKPAPNSELAICEEGCLSLPGRGFFIERYYTILASWKNAAGHFLVDEVLTGLASRMFQHEHDHLRGVLLTDLPNHEPTGKFDQEQAVEEGWILAESDSRGLEIQLDDEQAKFPSDRAAAAYVAVRAGNGSSYHGSALRFIREYHEEREG